MRPPRMGITWFGLSTARGVEVGPDCDPYPAPGLRYALYEPERLRSIYESHTNAMMTKPTGVHAPSQPNMIDTLIPVSATFLTLSEVADALRLSPMTVHRLVRRRKLRAFRLTRHFRFHRADVAALLENGRAATNHDGP